MATDLSHKPGRLLYVPWSCPRCEVQGTVGLGRDTKLPGYMRTPCCGMRITIYPLYPPYMTDTKPEVPHA